MYQANKDRYDSMIYRKCGNSGLKLPAVSLGLWHNFGTASSAEKRREILCGAFDRGVTYFDLANNYGPVYGAAEENFGKAMDQDFRPYRDELIIATKAGWDMWPGPYGDHGSRKYLIASLDQSLIRLKLDYVDIFYHHRADPGTPLEETALALDQIVRQGKALYVGISNYNGLETTAITRILRELRTPFIVHQPRYNMFSREMEKGLADAIQVCGLGAVCYSPLAQGLLSGRYLDGIPEGSRATEERFLHESDVTEVYDKITRLNAIAQRRGQTLSQLAIAWNLRLPVMTSVIVGVSSLTQLDDNIGALNNLDFSQEELAEIEAVLSTT